MVPYAVLYALNAHTTPRAKCSQFKNNSRLESNKEEDEEVGAAPKNVCMVGGTEERVHGGGTEEGLHRGIEHGVEHRPHHRHLFGYRGTSLIRKRTPLGPYRRPMPRVLEGS